MKRTTISILMLVAGLALVAALAMPAYASSSYCYGNRPSCNAITWHGNCVPTVTATPTTDAFRPAPPIKVEISNGNANCKANICNSGNKKACVTPVITLVGNKCPKKASG